MFIKVVSALVISLLLVACSGSSIETSGPDATTRPTNESSPIDDDTGLAGDGETVATTDDPSAIPSDTAVPTTTPVPTATPEPTATPIPAPIAAFSVSGGLGTAPLAVTITSESAGPVDSWEWDLGGGRTATGKKVVFEYVVAGEYDVTLLVGGPGGTDSTTVEAAVIVEPGPLATVEIQPTELALTVGDSTEIELKGFDAHGNMIPDQDFSWMEWSVDESTGVFTSPGHLSASTEPSKIEQAIRIVGSHEGRSYSLDLDVKVVVGPIESVVVSPSEISASPESIVAIGISAQDSFGNEITELEISSGTVASLGTFDGVSQFTAFSRAGTAESVVLAIISDGTGEHEALVDIEIIPGPLAGLELISIPDFVDISGIGEIVAVPVDEYGNRLPELNINTSYSEGVTRTATGFIAPSQTTIIYVTLSTSDGPINVNSSHRILVASPGTLFVMPTYADTGFTAFGTFEGIESNLRTPFGVVGDTSGFDDAKLLEYNETGVYATTNNYDAELESYIYTDLPFGVYNAYADMDHQGIFATSGGFASIGTQAELADEHPVDFVETPLIWSHAFFTSPLDTRIDLGAYDRSKDRPNKISTFPAGDLTVEWEPIPAADAYRITISEIDNSSKILSTFEEVTGDTSWTWTASQNQVGASYSINVMGLTGAGFELGEINAQYGEVAATTFFLRVTVPFEGDSLADLGNLEDEALHELVGWSFFEDATVNPNTAPSGDRSKRFQFLGGEHLVTIRVPEPGESHILKIESDDGGCDDSFDVSVAEFGVIYTYLAQPIDETVQHSIELAGRVNNQALMELTFINTATDDCGLSAIYRVWLEAL